jgi:uncharacterized protein YcbX
MRVVDLWRFPVKSLGGEQVHHSQVGPLGLHGDRRWGIVDLDAGVMLTARRVAELLYASARLDGDEPNPGVVITLPDGTELHSAHVATTDAALSAWLGRRVQLQRGEKGVTAELENPLDVEREANWQRWTSADGAFHDSSRTRVSLVSTATLGSWDRRRFRANIVVDGSGEDDLVDERLRIGATAVLHVRKHIDRCVMVTRPQPGGIERDLGVLRHINAKPTASLAIALLVRAEGTIAVGDEVRVE